jgi:hypothetical protein
VEPAREALRRLLKDGKVHLHVENGARVARSVVLPTAVFLGDGYENAAPNVPRAAYSKSGCGGLLSRLFNEAAIPRRWRLVA